MTCPELERERRDDSKAGCGVKDVKLAATSLPRKGD